VIQASPPTGRETSLGSSVTVVVIRTPVKDAGAHKDMRAGLDVDVPVAIGVREEAVGLVTGVAATLKRSARRPGKRP